MANVLIKLRRHTGGKYAYEIISSLVIRELQIKKKKKTIRNYYIPARKTNIQILTSSHASEDVEQ